MLRPGRFLVVLPRFPAPPPRAGAHHLIIHGRQNLKHDHPIRRREMPQNVSHDNSTVPDISHYTHLIILNY